MATQDSQNFFDSFLDDYFAECEEHLTVIRRNLLELEPLVNQPQLKRSLLDELFRSFHSLKGLSGMVGVREAEQLAHDMESYLRSLRDQEVILRVEGVEALIQGTKMLELVISHYRTKAPAPNIESTLQQIHQVLPQEESREEAIARASTAPPAKEPVAPPPLQLKPEELEQLTTGLNQGMCPWQFEFTPSAERSQKGINVNYIRDRLQKSGQLIHAAPRMVANGGIIFDFLILSDNRDSSRADWQQDGLIYHLYPQQNAASEPSSPGLESPGPPEPPKTVEPPAAIKDLTPGEFASDSLEPEAKVPSPPALPVFNSTVSATGTANVVRVDLSRLDELMGLVGELVIARSRLEDQVKSLKGTVPEPLLRPLKESYLAIERQLRDLREAVMRVRLVPIGEIFARMQFAIRDLARDNHKQVTLELVGQNTEIDKFVVERMMDPLLHLVRNAVSHGLEPTEERLARQKNPIGKITLRASTAGEIVIIEVEDDGCGIDLDTVIHRARSQGFISDQVQPDMNMVLEILCSPGFSTREQADRGSGRGIGMSVVKNTVQELGGFLHLETTPNQGTHFTIQLPLTLAIADALIVIVGKQTFAIPLSSVREVLQLQPSAIAVVEQNQMIPYRNQVLPLIHLAHFFGFGTAADSTNGPDRVDAIASTRSGLLSVVILGSGLNTVGILVDQILGQQEIVVRALSDPLIQVPAIAGATELGDRRVVLILDTAALVQIYRFHQYQGTSKHNLLQPPTSSVFPES